MRVSKGERYVHCGPLRARRPSVALVLLLVACGCAVDSRVPGVEESVATGGSRSGPELAPGANAGDPAGPGVDGGERGDIPEQGLTLWFMADRGVVEQGGLVSAWIDQSPSGFTATQATLAARPGVLAEPDGLPMLSFDGADDGLDLPAGFASFDGASFFAVVEPRENPLCTGILHFSNGAAGDDIEFGRHQNGVLHYEVGASQISGVPEAFAADRRLLVSVVQAGSDTGEGAAPGTVELRIDGVRDAVGFVNLAPNVARSQNYVGRNSYTRQPADCSVYFRGLIGEIVFYPRGLPAAERDRVEAYLRDKWGLR